MNKLKASVFSAIVLFGAGMAADAFAAGRYYHGYHGGHAHTRVAIGVGIGSPFWYGPSPYYYRPYYAPAYYPPAYYPPAAYYPYPAAGLPAGPPVYAEQEQPAPSAAAPGAGYWYYCNESQTYYPHVTQCAGPWQRVAPQS